MILIKQLSKSYADKTVLNNLSLEIEQSQVVAIVGPSGSGKSTLLRMINGLETPTTGEVFLDGVLVKPENTNAICRQVGMVFQLFNLFEHFSVLENITYAPRKVLGQSHSQAGKRALELLEKVGLSDKANAYPSALSGGQKQRVAIARALAMDPQVMLFDEPTSALDPEKVKEVLDVIAKLAHTGMTIVLVTHEMGFARGLADRILFMDHGRILEDNTPAAFFECPTSLRAREFLQSVL